MLGYMYEEGDGLVKDYQEAVRWYQKAAEQGVQLALVSLSQLYATGASGVPQDQVESFKWAILAANRGHQRAKEMLEVYPQILSSSQVDKARKDAQVWVDKYWEAFEPVMMVPQSSSTKP